MDKKTRNKILYVGVAALWGIAIYRTWKNFQVKQENEEFEVINAPSFSPVQFNKDTFELLLPSSDPFLSAGWKASEKTETSVEHEDPKNTIKKEIPLPVQKVWPQIQYFGFVKNRDKNSTLCLLKIDGRQVQLSKGQKHNGLIVMNTYRDSVLVVYEGETKIVRK